MIDKAGRPDFLGYTAYIIKQNSQMQSKSNSIQRSILLFQN